MGIEAEDLRAIHAVLAEYGAALDEERYEDLGALWAEDAVLAVFGREYVGRQRILDFMRKAVKGKHLTGVPRIETEADGARAISDYVFYRGDDGALFSAGAYRDRLVRTPAGWRFARREIEIQLRPSSL